MPVNPGERCSAPVLDAQKRARLCGEPATTERTVEGVDVPLCDEHAARYDRTGSLQPEGEKPTPDPAVLRQALVSLRVAFDDLDDVIEDLLRPHRQRSWGHLTHAEKHVEAKGSILEAWRYLMRAIGAEVPPDPDDGGANGGPEPTH